MLTTDYEGVNEFNPCPCPARKKGRARAKARARAWVEIALRKALENYPKIDHTASL